MKLLFASVLIGACPISAWATTDWISSFDPDASTHPPQACSLEHSRHQQNLGYDGAEGWFALDHSQAQSSHITKRSEEGSSRSDASGV